MVGLGGQVVVDRPDTANGATRLGDRLAVRGQRVLLAGADDLGEEAGLVDRLAGRERGLDEARPDVGQEDRDGDERPPELDPRLAGRLDEDPRADRPLPDRRVRRAREVEAEGANASHLLGDVVLGRLDRLLDDLRHGRSNAGDAAFEPATRSDGADERDDRGRGARRDDDHDRRVDAPRADGHQGQAGDREDERDADDPHGGLACDGWARRA
jgi:hypothetical protein